MRAVARAWRKAVEEGDSAGGLVDSARHVVQSDARVGGLELARERVVVRREERAAAHVRDQVRERSMRNGHPVKGGRAAPELVEDHERMLGRVAQDGRRLLELNSKSREPRHDGVVGAHACEDPVDRREVACGRGHVAPEVREQHRQAGLA